MTFAHPVALLALLALPLWWWRRSRRLGRAGAARMSDTGAVALAGARPLLARLPAALRSAGIAALVIAAAGPVFAGGRYITTSDGISIVLAVDVSSSMLSQDFAPADRIDVAKQTALEFVRERPHDRIGLVAFAAQAFTLVPITTDYDVLEQALGAVHVGTVSEDGTAIGTAIGTAANDVRRAPGPSKVIVLLTDGVNNRGLVDPRTAAEAASAFGIRIYTIGVGSTGEAPVPTGQGLEGLRYQNMPVELDERLLGDVATMTGGRYFRATDPQSLRDIFGEINRLERTTAREVRRRPPEPTGRWPVAVGLLALALEVVVSSSLVVRVP